MTKNELREYCRAIKGAIDTSPEGENMFIIKVMDKIFSYTEDKISDDTPFRIMLKCDPQRAVELREKYRGITAGKANFAKAWNLVELDSDVPDELIRELVKHSVDEVIKKLTKKQQAEYLKL